MKHSLLILFFVVVCLKPLSGQDSLKIDEKLLQAKQLEHSGHRADAKNIVQGILAVQPENNDVRIFYAQLCAFDGEYNKAIGELKLVLRSDPKNLDGYVVISHVYAWNKELREAVGICDEGLKLSPENMELMLSKCRALEWLAEYRDAYAMAEAAMYKDPINTEARELYERLKDKFRKNYLAIYYYNTGFGQEGVANWHNSSLEYMRIVKKTPILVRLNQAYRYNINGFQVEADAYPRLGKKYYAYLNAGYSSEVRLFPTIRAGAELYRSLPKGFEASLGARLLNFTNSNTYLYTAYIGKYYKNFWFSYRPYMNRQPGQTYWSHTVSARLYGSSADNYITLTLANGNIPFLIAISQDLQRTTSNRVSIEVQKKFTRGFLIKAGFGYEYEEYYPELFRNRLTGWLAFIKRF